MKKRILLFIIGIVMCCDINAQNLNEDWFVNGEIGDLIELSSAKQTFDMSVGIGKEIGKYNALEIYNAMYFKDKFEMNTVCNLKTHLYYNTFDLNLGIGVGSLFTNAITDHHYHTYNISIEKNIKETFSYRYSVEGGFVWKTYAEHIGFNMNRCYLIIKFKIYYDIW